MTLSRRLLIPLIPAALCACQGCNILKSIINIGRDPDDEGNPAFEDTDHLTEAGEPTAQGAFAEGDSEGAGASRRPRRAQGASRLPGKVASRCWRASSSFWTPSTA